MFSKYIPSITLIFLALTATPAAAAFGKPAPDFGFRFRVLEAESADAPEENQRWFLAAANTNFPGPEAGEDGWSEWIRVEGDLKEFFATKTYPNLYLPTWPFVAAFTLHPHEFTRAKLEFEWEVNGRSGSFPATFSGRNIALLLWKDSGGEFRVGPSHEYNKRYLERAEALGLTPDDLPQKIVFGDRFIGIDSNEEMWRDGLRLLALLGFNAIQTTGHSNAKPLIADWGVARTHGAIYSPPLLHDADPEKTSDAALRAWADQIAEQFRSEGWEPGDVALYALADEPAWYFPSVFQGTWPEHSPEMGKQMLDNFRSYLRDEIQLQPSDVGIEAWEELRFAGRSDAGETPESRRLYLHTCRFFADNSADTFARATRALEGVFGEGLPIFCNWNFFSGRFFNPGPVANNPDTTSPDAAMGGHDWIDFGRRRAVTSLWTEDWFNDAMAPQWSFYSSKLRSAADHYNRARAEDDPPPIGFGGYVIGRATGDRPGGCMQKMLAILGHGGKQIKTFVFGPEYAFPMNCWSEQDQVFEEMASAMRFIGRAEDLLHPGVPVPAEVAIVTPQTAQVWDKIDEPIAEGIFDATNTSLNSATVDYIAETFNLFSTLQQANIPVDWVDEQDIEERDYLDHFKVLYLTTPNLSAAAVEGLADWVRDGGTLVAIAGAGQSDELNFPTDAMEKLLGVRISRRERIYSPQHMIPTRDIEPVRDRNLSAFAGRGFAETLKPTTASVIGRYVGGRDAAVTLNEFGKGRVITFGTLPGTARNTPGRDGGDALGWVVFSTVLAEINPPVVVDRERIETPVLDSEEGMAVTVLNWSDEEQQDIALRIRADRPVAAVESVALGAIPFSQNGEEITLALPWLGPADVLKVRWH